VVHASPQQVRSLQSMAEHELVAVSSQGSSAFILVPYLDAHKATKLAGFLLLF
jgi:hypothetical protein